MNLFYLIMYILALLCFLLGTIGHPRLPCIRLVALGLVFFTVAPVVQFATLVLSGG